MERSDAYKVKIDTNTGLISYDNKNKNKDKTMVNIPYCMKLLLQELESMSIAPRLVTESYQNNKSLMIAMHQNISKNSIQDNILDNDDIIEEED